MRFPEYILRMWINIFTVIFVFVFGAFTHGKTVKNPGLDIGMELQFGQRTFSNLVDYFDIQKMKENKILKIPEFVLANYIDSNTLSAIKKNHPDVFSYLTEGLNTKIQHQSPESFAERRLSIAQVGHETPKEHQLPKLPEPKELRTYHPGLSSDFERKEFSGHQSTNAISKFLTDRPELDAKTGLLFPVGTRKDSEFAQHNHKATEEIREINRRWRTLSKRKRRKIIDLNLIPSRWKTFIIFKQLVSKTEHKSEIVLPLQKHVSSKIRSFLERFRVHIGNLEMFRYVEFVHRHSVKGKTTNRRAISQFHGDLNQLATMAGVKTQIELPLEVLRGDIGFHYHLSYNHAPKSDINPVFQRLNARLLLTLLTHGKDKGIGPDIFTGEKSGKFSPVLYRPLHRKGLLSQKAPNRIEVRAHYASPEIEIEDYRRILTLKTRSALHVLDKEIQDLLTIQIVRMFDRRDGPEALFQLLSDIGYKVKPELRDDIFKILLSEFRFGEIIDALIKFIKRYPEREREGVLISHLDHFFNPSNGKKTVRHFGLGSYFQKLREQHWL